MRVSNWHQWNPAHRSEASKFTCTECGQVVEPGMYWRWGETGVEGRWDQELVCERCDPEGLKLWKIEKWARIVERAL